MTEFRPFEDPEEVEKIRQKREELIKSLENYDISDSEALFILRKISIITEKLLNKARYSKELK